MATNLLAATRLPTLAERYGNISVGLVDLDGNELETRFNVYSAADVMTWLTSSTNDHEQAESVKNALVRIKSYMEEGKSALLEL